jgi:glycosyltransferase involved in cell wall biosynthesis
LIDILLSTYNGTEFLEDQVSSLFSQNCKNWTLLVRDDGSTDETVAILGRLCSRSRTRLTADAENLGPCRSFERLLKQSSAPYCMFCDQDDVWLPDKIEKSLVLMHEMERRWGNDTPILIHSDLQVVDRHLQPLAPSFWRHQGIEPERRETFNRLLVQNVVTGCTVMINAPLRQIALPFAAETLMHDWWLALTAAAFGRIGRLNEPTVLYRQHGGNEVGAKRWGPRLIWRRLNRWSSEVEEATGRTQRQAAAFNRRFGTQLTEDQREVLAFFTGAEHHHYLSNARGVLRHRLFKAGWLRTLGLIASL